MTAVFCLPITALHHHLRSVQHFSVGDVQFSTSCGIASVQRAIPRADVFRLPPPLSNVRTALDVPLGREPQRKRGANASAMMHDRVADGDGVACPHTLPMLTLHCLAGRTRLVYAAGANSRVETPAAVRAAPHAQQAKKKNKEDSCVNAARGRFCLSWILLVRDCLPCQ